ncbi:MAG: hypothetical protein ACKPIC_03785 [Microcystis panniformis]
MTALLRSLTENEVFEVSGGTDSENIPEVIITAPRYPWWAETAANGAGIIAGGLWGTLVGGLSSIVAGPGVGAAAGAVHSTAAGIATTSAVWDALERDSVSRTSVEFIP